MASIVGGVKSCRRVIEESRAGSRQVSKLVTAAKKVFRVLSHSLSQTQPICIFNFFSSKIFIYSVL